MSDQQTPFFLETYLKLTKDNTFEVCIASKDKLSALSLNKVSDDLGSIHFYKNTNQIFLPINENDEELIDRNIWDIALNNLLAELTNLKEYNIIIKEKIMECSTQEFRTFKTALMKTFENSPFKICVITQYNNSLMCLKLIKYYTIFILVHSLGTKASTEC